MSLYNRNLDFLKRNSEQLYWTVAEDRPIFDLKVERVEGQFNYIVEHEDKRCFCHSIYSQKRELSEMFRGVSRDVDSIVVFGFGNGEFISYAAEFFKKDISVIVIEPNLQLFREVIKEVDLNTLFDKVRDVRLIINKNVDEATHFTVYSINSNLKGGFGMVSGIASRTLFSSYYDKLKDSIVSFFQDIHVNIKTDNFFKYQWALNTLSNLKAKALPVETKVKSLEGVTGIIVAAGPSLNRNIHLLKDVGDKALIVAVGSAIKILHSHGIVPHIRIAIDGAPEEANIFKDIYEDGVPLLFTNTLLREVVRKYEGPKYRGMVGGDYFGKYVYAKNDWEHIQISSGFSVSNIAMSFLCELKCRRVVFIGQDLCFTGGEIYAKGSWTDEAVTDPEKRGFTKIKDMYGEDVYTQKAMLGIKRQVEYMMPRYPDIEFINASQGGLRIEGTKELSLQEVLDGLEDGSSSVVALKQRLAAFDEAEADKYIEKICATVRDIEKDLDKIEDINNARLKRLKKLKKYKEKNLGQNRILSELKSLDSFEKELDELPYYDTVVAMFFKDTFDTFTLKYYYNGEDTEKEIEYRQSIQDSRAREIKTYIIMLRKMIDAYYGENAAKDEDPDLSEAIEPEDEDVE